jgi:hypothetical protein
MCRNIALAFSSVAGKPSFAKDNFTSFSFNIPDLPTDSELYAFNIFDSRSFMTALKSSHDNDLAK